MAHNINFDNNRFNCFVAGAPAWHNLGVNVKDCQTWQEAQTLAGISELDEEPIHTDFEVCTRWKAIIRRDNHKTVGVVGADFGLVQPSTAFGFLDTLLESHDAHFESAGLLGETGGRMWALARIPAADIEVTPGDKSETYLMVAQGFDGSMRLIGKTCSTRVVCQNTQQAALAEKTFTLSLKHTKNINQRLDNAKKLVSGVTQSAKTLEEKLRKLAQRRLKKEPMIAILDRLFPAPKDKNVSTARHDNVLSDILRLYELNDGNAFPEQRGTAFNLLNAITNYTDHERSTRSNGKGESYHRAESALFGSGAQLKQEALQVIYQLTDGTEETRLVSGPDVASRIDSPSSSLVDDILRRMEEQM